MRANSMASMRPVCRTELDGLVGERTDDQRNASILAHHCTRHRVTEALRVLADRLILRLLRRTRLAQRFGPPLHPALVSTEPRI